MKNKTASNTVFYAGNNKTKQVWIMKNVSCFEELRAMALCGIAHDIIDGKPTISGNMIGHKKSLKAFQDAAKLAGYTILE